MVLKRLCVLIGCLLKRQNPGTHPGFSSGLLGCGSESNEKMCQRKGKKTNQYLSFHLKCKNLLVSLPIFTFSGLEYRVQNASNH